MTREYKKKKGKKKEIKTNTHNISRSYDLLLHKIHRMLSTKVKTLFKKPFLLFAFIKYMEILWLT